MEIFITAILVLIASYILYRNIRNIKNGKSKCSTCTLDCSISCDDYKLKDDKGITFMKK